MPVSPGSGLVLWSEVVCSLVSGQKWSAGLRGGDRQSFLIPYRRSQSHAYAPTGQEHTSVQAMRKALKQSQAYAPTGQLLQ